jgi:hypothetical protein
LSNWNRRSTKPTAALKGTFTLGGKIKNPVDVAFTGVCFDLLFEKVELAGTEPYGYPINYQLLTFSKFLQIPELPPRNAMF